MLLPVMEPDPSHLPLDPPHPVRCVPRHRCPPPSRCCCSRAPGRSRAAQNMNLAQSAARRAQAPRVPPGVCRPHAAQVSPFPCVCTSRWSPRLAPQARWWGRDFPFRAPALCGARGEAGLTPCPCDGPAFRPARQQHTRHLLDQSVWAPSRSGCFSHPTLGSCKKGV